MSACPISRRKSHPFALKSPSHLVNNRFGSPLCHKFCSCESSNVRHFSASASQSLRSPDQPPMFGIAALRPIVSAKPLELFLLVMMGGTRQKCATAVG